MDDKVKTAGSTVAIVAAEAPARLKPSSYPEPFLSMMAGRRKHPLGDLFGLKNFGVNLTYLVVGGQSALFHRHSKQDEFIYVVSGTPTLYTESGETILQPGMCAGFPAGGTAHQLVNHGSIEAVILEVGDRSAGDEGTYPRDDIQAVLGADSNWIFTHKDGRPY